MAITVTTADIKEFCPSISSPDAVIQSIIDTVLESVGACLESSYSENTAETILKATVCHLLTPSQGGEVKSERAPNGASTTFVKNEAGTGLDSTEMGRLASQLDSKDCLSSMFATTYLFFAGGADLTPSY